MGGGAAGSLGAVASFAGRLGGAKCCVKIAPHITVGPFQSVATSYPSFLPIPALMCGALSTQPIDSYWPDLPGKTAPLIGNCCGDPRIGARPLFPAIRAW